VQIETNLVLLLPALIEQNKLLSFISRRNIERGTRVNAEAIDPADPRLPSSLDPARGPVGG